MHGDAHPRRGTHARGGCGNSLFYALCALPAWRCRAACAVACTTCGIRCTARDGLSDARKNLRPHAAFTAPHNPKCAKVRKLFGAARDTGSASTAAHRRPRGCDPARACVRPRARSLAFATRHVRAPGSSPSPTAREEARRDHPRSRGETQPSPDQPCGNMHPQTTPAARGGRSRDALRGREVSRLPRAVRRRRPGRACR